MGSATAPITHLCVRTEVPTIPIAPWWFLARWLSILSVTSDSLAVRPPPTEPVHRRRSPSWQLPPDCVTQQNLQQQQRETRNNREREEFFDLHVSLHLTLGFFQLIDGIIGRPQGLRTVSSVISSASLLRHRLQGLFVNIHRHLHVNLLSKRVHAGHGRSTPRAHSDCVHFNI